MRQLYYIWFKWEIIGHTKKTHTHVVSSSQPTIGHTKKTHTYVVSSSQLLVRLLVYVLAFNKCCLIKMHSRIHLEASTIDHHDHHDCCCDTNSPNKCTRSNK